MSVLIVTSLGDIVIDLHTDRCPLTCKNFLKLCKIKYYNGCLFHTVQKDFTAQTGDPTGTGAGGDSVYKFLYGDQARFFSDEIHLDLKHSKTGTVAMASAGENLNASQFYFTLRDDLDYLDEKHTVFGEIAEGFDTLTRINEAYVDEKNRPYKNIRIKHTYILDDPFDDPPQLAELIPDASPEGKPTAEVEDDVRLEDDWVPMDEQLAPHELEEVLRAKTAHSSAVVLESIGDIPDAEIKPPDNVLFVCKLNPVTEDEDLHTIFSRFGAVISAEVIRDFKTGDSLCYAFIEFETKEACEQAYFKMDNALIDDRRIHVDFSQSVAKLWSQYRSKDTQKGTGKGCFKCGSTDHIARDCTGGAANNQPSKYILKDENRQHGGGDDYDMVFDGDVPDSPRREKRHRSHDQIKRVEREKIHRRSPHGYGEEKRRHRDERDGEDREKADRYSSRREEARDKDRYLERRRERDDDQRNKERDNEHKHFGRRGERDRDRGDGREVRDEQRDKEKHRENRRDRDDERDKEKHAERRRERDGDDRREMRDKGGIKRRIERTEERDEERDKEKHVDRRRERDGNDRRETRDELRDKERHREQTRERRGER